MATDDAVRGSINIGNPVDFTMIELARHVLAGTGSIEIEYRPLPLDDPRQRQPGIALAPSFLAGNQRCRWNRA